MILREDDADDAGRESKTEMRLKTATERTERHERCDYEGQGRDGMCYEGQGRDGMRVR